MTLDGKCRESVTQLSQLQQQCKFGLIDVTATEVMPKQTGVCFFTVHLSTRKHWVCWELPLDDAGCGGNVHSSFFRWSSISRRQVKATCLSRVSTYDSRPLVSDAWGRWRLSLFRFVCTPNKLSAALPPATWALLRHWSTDTDRYTSTTTIRDQRWMETYIKPHQFFGSFFLPYVGHARGYSVQTCDNLLLLSCGKLVVSLTRLEFLLHTYMAFSHVFKLFKVGFKPTAGLARHIHFACTDINQLFHTI